MIRRLRSLPARDQANVALSQLAEHYFTGTTGIPGAAAAGASGNSADGDAGREGLTCSVHGAGANRSNYAIRLGCGEWRI